MPGCIQYHQAQPGHPTNLMPYTALNSLHWPHLLPLPDSWNTSLWVHWCFIHVQSLSKSLLGIFPSLFILLKHALPKICFLCGPLKRWLFPSSPAVHTGHGDRAESSLFVFVCLFICFCCFKTMLVPPSSPLKKKNKQLLRSHQQMIPHFPLLIAISYTFQVILCVLRL